MSGPRIVGADGEFAFEVLMVADYWPPVANPEIFHEVCALSASAVEMLWSMAPVRFVGRDLIGRPRTFDLDDDGEQAVLLPAYDENGRLIDIAAFDVRDAGKCAMRGNAWMIGADNAAKTDPETPRVLVNLTWRDWFRRGGAGVLVLDYEVAAGAFRDNGVQLVTATDADRRHLTNLLTASARPSVQVLTNREAA